MTHQPVFKKRKSFSSKHQDILWPPLIRGTLIKRYKRFLADIELDSGEIITAHCPNSGSMKASSEPGRPVYVSFHDNPRRKLKYTWELIAMPESLVGVNTNWPNQLVSLAISQGFVPEVSGYSSLSQEVRVGEHSRLDILLSDDDNRQCYIEVKNCTLVSEGIAAFPDAVTTRGRKHLIELQQLISPSVRCVMFYLIQRMDAERFRPADEIDPEYGKELRRAYQNGVEILVYDVTIDLNRIGLRRPVPFEL